MIEILAHALLEGKLQKFAIVMILLKDSERFRATTLEIMRSVIVVLPEPVPPQIPIISRSAKFLSLKIPRQS